VNWLPWSVLKISGLPQQLIASCTALLIFMGITVLNLLKKYGVVTYQLC